MQIRALTARVQVRPTAKRVRPDSQAGLGPPADTNPAGDTAGLGPPADSGNPAGQHRLVWARRPTAAIPPSNTAGLGAAVRQRHSWSQHGWPWAAAGCAIASAHHDRDGDTILYATAAGHFQLADPESATRHTSASRQLLVTVLRNAGIEHKSYRSRSQQRGYAKRQDQQWHRKRSDERRYFKWSSELWFHRP